MPLNPEEVVNKRFSATKFRQGYDEEEVDEFLDEVVADLRRLNAENAELRSKLAACEGRVTELAKAGANQPGAKPVGVPSQQGPSSQPALTGQPASTSQPALTSQPA
jgi:DivIVA domain-containing protein